MCPVEFALKRGWLIMNIVARKYCVTMSVLNLRKDLFLFCLTVLVGVGTKDKPLMRTEISSSVNVWSESLRTIFCCTGGRGGGVCFDGFGCAFAE